MPQRFRSAVVHVRGGDPKPVYPAKEYCLREKRWLQHQMIFVVTRNLPKASLLLTTPEEHTSATKDSPACDCSS